MGGGFNYNASVPTPAPAFSRGTIFWLISNSLDSAVWVRSTCGSCNPVTIESSASFYNYVTNIPISFNTGYAVPVNYFRYYIDWTNALHPVLMFDNGTTDIPRPLATDIEDIQFAYYVEGQGWKDCPTTASWIPNITMVRINVVARTEFEDRTWHSGHPISIENHNVSGAPNDGFKRRVYTAVVMVPQHEKLRGSVSSDR
jgi:hypothetical protein